MEKSASARLASAPHSSICLAILYRLDLRAVVVWGRREHMIRAGVTNKRSSFSQPGN